MKCLDNQVCKVLCRPRSFNFFSRLSYEHAAAPCVLGSLI